MSQTDLFREFAGPERAGGGGARKLFLIRACRSDPYLTGNESQRKHCIISSYNKVVDSKTDKITKRGKTANICLVYESILTIIFDFSEHFY